MVPPSKNSWLRRWACRALDSIIPGPENGLSKFEWFSRRFKHINSIEGDINSSTEDGLLFARCYEWRLNMQTGEVRERNLTGIEGCCNITATL